MNDMTPISAQPAYSERVQALLKRAPALFIDGEWVASSHGKTLAVHDPSTGREIAAIVDASDADAEVVRMQHAQETGPIAWHHLDASADTGTTLGRAVKLVGTLAPHVLVSDPREPLSRA